MTKDKVLEVINRVAIGDGTIDDVRQAVQAMEGGPGPKGNAQALEMFANNMAENAIANWQMGEAARGGLIVPFSELGAHKQADWYRHQTLVQIVSLKIMLAEFFKWAGFLGQAVPGAPVEPPPSASNGDQRVEE